MARLSLSLFAAFALAASLASHAETMDYSYVELAYVDSEFDADDFDVDGDGFSLRGSLPINDRFFVFAGYQDLGFDFDLDVTNWEVGGGAHWPLRDKLDIIGRLAIVNQEAEVGALNVDDDGFLLGARLRGEVIPKLELEGGFDYIDVGDEDDTFIILEGRYFFIEQVSGGLFLSIGDDVTSIGIAGRLTF